MTADIAACRHVRGLPERQLLYRYWRNTAGGYGSFAGGDNATNQHACRVIDLAAINRIELDGAVVAPFSIYHHQPMVQVAGFWCFAHWLAGAGKQGEGGQWQKGR